MSMKKAVVVGGSNGIGLAIANVLLERNYYVEILDRVAPDPQYVLKQDMYAYHPCDLLYFNDTLFETLSADPDVEVLMITAGFGRVAEFEYLHSAEISNMLQVNTAAGIKIIRHFYERIKSKAPFYCGIMGSIAGFISSPMFSVYAASKAAVCRFTESVNIELEVSGTENRILNVSPGSIKGTRFNGGENDPAQTRVLAEEITSRMLARETLYIPEYETIYKDVLRRYHDDPHAYGLHSYQYKKDSGRVCNEKKACVGYLSGTFDLFHVGHLNLLKRAKRECDYLIVGVHADASHKGKQTYISFEDRMEIVASCRYVDKAVPSCREDSDAWALHHYDKLFVGSDYKGTERFLRYEEYFKDKGVHIVYFPYTQGISSSQIRADLSERD